MIYILSSKKQLIYVEKKILHAVCTLNHACQLYILHRVYFHLPLLVFPMCAVVIVVFFAN